MSMCTKRAFCQVVPSTLIAVPMAVCVWLSPCEVLGSTWADAMKVNVDDNRDDKYVRIDVSSDGVPWLVWQGVDPAEGDIEVYFSRYVSGAWEIPMRLHENNQVDDKFPEISIGSDDVPWVVWKSGRDFYDWDLLASRWSDEGWSDPDTLGSGLYIVSDSDVYARDSSEVWVAWDVLMTEEPYDWEVFVRRYYEGVWEEAYRFDRPDCDDYFPGVTTDHSRVPWLTWGSGPSGSVRIVVSSKEGDWSEPALVDPAGPRAHYGKIGCARDGSVWVLWRGSRRDEGSNSEILYRMLGEGGWGKVGAVNEPDEGSNADDVRVSFYAGERCWPAVVWNADLQPYGPPHLDVRYSAWDGQGWTGEEVVSVYQAPEYGIDEFPDVAVGPEGRVWVAWSKIDVPPDYDLDVYATYSGDALPVVVHSCSTRVVGGGIELSWSAFGYGDLGTFDVYRAEADSASDCFSREIPESAERVNDVGLVATETMSYVDSSVVGETEYCYWLVHKSAGGDTSSFWLGREMFPRVVNRSRILGVYPTPSSGGVYISYELARSSELSFEIFDGAGRLVRSVDLGLMGSGSYVGDGAFYWDGKGKGSGEVPSGVYLVMMLVGSEAVGEAKVVIVR